MKAASKCSYKIARGRRMDYYDLAMTEMYLRGVPLHGFTRALPGFLCTYYLDDENIYKGNPYSGWLFKIPRKNAKLNPDIRTILRAQEQCR
jgi:hypothetical protein